METFGEYFGIFCFALIMIGFLIMLFYKVQEMMTFKRGHNPYARICKKCGAHQNMYQSNIEGCEDDMWWEEVYPIGNDEKCRCHGFAHNRG